MTTTGSTSRAFKLLPHFPAGLPDETIGSRVSRYHIHRGQPTMHATYVELFNRAPFGLTGLVQPYLENLAERLPGLALQNLQTIQNESTLLPLFRQFSGGNSSPTTNDSLTHPSNLRRRITGDGRLTHICAQCLVDDEANHGCAYIHRSHQIPGVTVCWKHAKSLIDRCPSCRRPFAQPNRLILSAWAGCGCGESISAKASAPQNPASEVEIGFARFTHDLLIADAIKLSPDRLAKLHRERAAEKGYAWGSSQVNRTEFLKAITDFFGRDLLSRVDPAFGRNKISGWFLVFSLTASVESPLNRRLLFSYFLFRDAATLLERANQMAEGHPEPHSGLDSGGNGPIEPFALPEQNETEIETKALLNGLVKAARRYGWDSERLWHHQPGTMQKLVKVMPNACTIIDERLEAAAAAARKMAVRINNSKLRLADIDAQWAKAIQASAIEIYAKEERPFRVTMNRVVKAANFPKRNGQVPMSNTFPLARAAAEACAESTWHFYARRLLWTLQSLHVPDRPFCRIMILARLEIYKGEAVFDYFSDVVRCGGASIVTINAILGSHEIGKNWQGPCPDRVFYKAGRAYKLRTSRRGPIGGRTGPR